MRVQTIFGTVLFFLMMLAASMFSIGANAQKPKEIPVQDNAAAMFHFTAEHMLPVRGTSRYLTDNYFLRVSKDSVTADLPYIGRVFVPVLGGEGGIRFTSTDFTIEDRVRKKGRREVIIKTKDTKTPYTFRITWFTDNNASLNFSATDRETISYRGRISPLD